MTELYNNYQMLSDERKLDLLFGIINEIDTSAALDSLNDDTYATLVKNIRQFLEE